MKEKEVENELDPILLAWHDIFINNRVQNRLQCISNDLNP